MGGLHSRNKGKRGEREVRDLFKKHGFEARRGQQFSGNPDAPDVVTELTDYHIEVKFVESLNVYDAMKQATRDSGDSSKTPVVFHRKSNIDWHVTLTAEDFFELITKIHDEQQRQKDSPLHHESNVSEITAVGVTEIPNAPNL